MSNRFVCTCGMAFSVDPPHRSRPVACPACGAVQDRASGSRGMVEGDPPFDSPVPGLLPSIGIDTDAAERDRRPPAESAPPDDADEATVRCPACDALNRADDALCGLCGARLGLDLLLATSAPAPGTDADADLDPPLVGEGRVREAVRYEGALRVPMVRLVLRTLLRPRKEMETLVSFLSYRDMVWKLMVLFVVGVVGLWIVGWQHAKLELPIVSGFTFGARMPLKASWYVWLGMAFSAAALITAGLTFLAAAAGLLTGHGWNLSPLALAFMFIVSLVNAAHLLLMPVGLLGETAVVAGAWVLLAWEVMLTVFVINKVLDCDAVLSFILALVICAVTVHFYNRVFKLTEHILPGQDRVGMGYSRGR